jgi:hypothetical protein
MNENLEDANSRDKEKPPGQLYASGDKNKRKRLYPCPDCGDDADGSHQCGGCFTHMHAICGAPYPGSCEGNGQRRLCHDCIQTPLGGQGEPNVFPGLARAAEVVSHQKLSNAQKAPERKRVRMDQLASKYNDLSQDNIEDATVKSLLPPHMDMELIARDEHCMFRALAISAPYA